MCNGVSNADPDYFLDGESDFLRFRNGLWASKRSVGIMTHMETTGLVGRVRFI